MMITWKHTDKDFPLPWTIDTKILIFHERTLGWQIQMGELIANGGTHLNGTAVAPIPDSGFAVLQICLSYLETIGKYMDGYAHAGKSEHYFKEGAKSVFHHLATGFDPVLHNLYEAARCGLYHGSMTCLGVGVSADTADAIICDPVKKTMTINPHRFPAALNDHLSEYVRRLNDTAEAVLRKKFEDRFNMEYGIDPAKAFTPPPGVEAELSGARPPTRGPAPAAPASFLGSAPGASGVATPTTV